MMSISDQQLTRAFREWQPETTQSTNPELEPHLNESQLLHLAAAGGLEAATPKELRHLDACAICFGAWAAWRRALSATQDQTDTVKQTPNQDSPTTADDDFICAFGFQEAAASSTPETSEPRIYTSNCGSWRLELLPGRESPKRGLLILTALQGNKATGQITVFDRRGKEILAGSLENGRLARLCEDFTGLDLSVWTVISKDT